jgi:hypothetical protein
MYERDRLQDVTLIQEKLARGLQQAENGEFTEQSVGEIIAEAKARKNAKKPSTS